MSVFKYKLKLNRISIYFLGLSILHIRYNLLYRNIVKYLLKKRMDKKLTMIKNKAKIRVGFLVTEQSKWGYQSVYDKLKSNPKYEPVILVTKMFLEHTNQISFYKKMNDCINFFINKGMKVEIAYDEKNKKYLPLDEFNVDIVFYQQPWELDIIQHPLKVSKYAITMYSPYGFDLVEHGGPYFERFHRWLDVYFTPTSATLSYITKIAKNVTNCKVVGNPKLDLYFDVKIEHHVKPIIIYAPHHSFIKKSLQLATFQFNGLKILELAQNTKDKFDWVLKPHPKFLQSVIQNNIMSEYEINKYYEEWKKIGRIYDTGDYISLFKNSYALITDCCSFLAEYLPSKHPVLHLINENARFNDTGKEFLDSYYSIYNISELLDIFNEVLIKDNDYKKQERLEKVSLIFNENETTASKIIDTINNFIN